MRTTTTTTTRFFSGNNLLRNHMLTPPKVMLDASLAIKLNLHKAIKANQDSITSYLVAHPQSNVTCFSLALLNFKQQSIKRIEFFPN